MDISKFEAKFQLQYIQDLLIKIASGDFNPKMPASDEDNEQVSAILIGIDMLVEELKATTISREFFNGIYNGITDMLFVLDETGIIQKSNHVTETMLSYSESEFVGSSIEKLLLIDDIELIRDCIKNTSRKKKSAETGFNLIAKNKTVIPVSCSFSRLYNNEGDPTGILLVAKDITALINAKNQLQDKNDELNLFVYKASHDLKSPISSMMGVMTLINKSRSLEEIKMYCKMIEECTDKLNIVIKDLLILGRITYGELEYEKVAIKDVIDNILKSIEFIDGFKNVRINTTLDKNAKTILTEKGLFHTLMSNLVDNSIKYRQREDVPSYINIIVKKKGSGILIKIEDNGIGIESPLQANIFKMFYRATYTSKGSGLGLYIVKTSVLKLGGTISFESVPGEGTCFTIYLPSKNNN